MLLGVTIIIIIVVVIIVIIIITVLRNSNCALLTFIALCGD